MTKKTLIWFLLLPFPSHNYLSLLLLFAHSRHAGDDMVPRATAASLERLEKRLLDYVSDGGGGGIYFDYAK